MNRSENHLRREFVGKVALVTGAGSGLGRAIALAFAREGASVAVAGRRREKLSGTASDIGRSGTEALVLAGDVRRPADCGRWVRRIRRAFGRLDILVNSAGVFSMGGLGSSPAQWDRVMDTNVRGMFLMTQAAVPALKKGKGGAILNLSSTAGEVRPFPTVMPYCVSKAAVGMFTKCVALELAPFGIRVNAIAPGVVPTELHRSGGMAPRQYGGFLARSAALHPIGGNGSPSDIAEAALYLCSGRARWVTGITLILDGGRTLVSPR